MLSIINKKFIISVKIILIFVFTNIEYVEAKSKETIKLIELFSNVLEKTHSDYIEEISEKELIEKAINGMLIGLDPHSGYMNEDEYQSMQVDTSGKFGGLGIQITMEDGYVKTISPIDDTPAYEADLKAGDYITQIDGIPVLGLNLNEAVDLMRGKPGSKITISIAREGLEIFDVTIVRDIIKIQSVKHDVYGNVGYLRISSFTEQTKSGLKKAIKKIKLSLDKNEVGYILDLRSNPGGLLNQAVAVSDIFLEDGEIVSTRGRKNRNIKSYYAKSNDLINSKPLVVLINGGSASASEIVAGALQDHNRAIVMGTKSFGKGSVQTIIPIYDTERQGAIRLTTARYYTPSGKSIQGKGINPDIEVKQGQFKADDLQFFSESDLIGSLDNNDNDTIKDKGDEVAENLEQEDYQLSRAINLVNALSILNKPTIN